MGSTVEPVRVDEPEWVMYRERDDWKDVTPVPQDDGQHPVVCIAYSDQFSDVHDYLRAVMRSGEVSLRALRLVSAALDLNPANYTAWQLRRDLLEQLGCPLQAELDHTRPMIEDNPKNYQVWHHRRWLVERLQCADAELRLTRMSLSADPKNFHAWQFRQWVISEFGLFGDELEFVEQLLEEDVRNNSAWNQRYFVVRNTDGFTEDVVEREIFFCIDRLRKAIDNESVWNYARGVLAHSATGVGGCEVLMELARGWLDEGVAGRHAISFLVDGLLEQGGEPEEPLRLMNLLADSVDTIRRNYWRYRHSKLCSATSASRGDAAPDNESR